MASILVVCTGNVCRSPVAEGLLRRGLGERFGDDAPDVASAGTAAWEGSGAMPESVQASAERGVDIGAHVARLLSPELVAQADLLVGMAAGHRDAVGDLVPEAAARSFTLKELVRLLEALPSEAGPGHGPAFEGRIGAADVLRRRGSEGNAWDEDVVDPLGMPLDTYRAIAWELDEWIDRLVEGLFGPVPAAVPGEEA